jgi:hypothetical protein
VGSIKHRWRREEEFAIDRTKISFERRLINNEAWLPIKTTLDLNVGYRALVLVHATGKARLITEYSDFKKYDVDTILKFGQPVAPPK